MFIVLIMLRDSKILLNVIISTIINYRYRLYKKIFNFVRV